jgi:hypothetical protein
MRWRNPLILTAALCIAAACQDQTPTGLTVDQTLSDQELLASHGQPGKEMPIRGEFVGGATGQTFAPNFPVERDTFQGRCSIPSDWVIGFWGEGNIPHLGKVTALVSHCSQANLATGAATYSDGILKIFAPNGDEVWGTYGSGESGPLSPTLVWWRDVIVFDGGTGRFANATGGGSEWGTFDLTTGVLEYEVEGVISYDASDRRAR